MRLEVDLSEWCDDRHIYVLAGMELAAYKHVNQPCLVKTSRCDMCGKCCVFKDGPCEHLVPDGSKMICGLGVRRPFACCVSIGSLRVDGCSERFEWLRRHQV